MRFPLYLNDSQRISGNQERFINTLMSNDKYLEIFWTRRYFVYQLDDIFCQSWAPDWIRLEKRPNLTPLSYRHLKLSPLYRRAPRPYIFKVLLDKLQHTLALISSCYRSTSSDHIFLNYVPSVLIYLFYACPFRFFFVISYKSSGFTLINGSNGLQLPLWMPFLCLPVCL